LWLPLPQLCDERREQFWIDLSRHRLGRERGISGIGKLGLPIP